MKDLAGLHTGEWIAALYDGELRGEQLEQVQNHLAGCARCQAELEALKELSAVLQSAPAPFFRTPARRYAANLMLQLPREQRRPWHYQALKTVWKTAPLWLLAAWAFVQAAALVAGICLWVFADILPGGSTASLLPASLNLGGWAGVIIPVVEVMIIDTLLTLLLAGLTWGWLASWWAVRKA